MTAPKPKLVIHLTESRARTAVVDLLLAFTKCTRWIVQGRLVAANHDGD
jgi:hypothetical protein